MNYSYKLKFVLTATAALGLFPVFSGCGGGASQETTVTPKASRTDGGDTAADSGGGTAAVEGFGTLSGTITFEGTAPVLPLIVKQGDSNVRDAVVCAIADIPNESLVVQGGKIANVFIYLDKAPKGVDVPPASEETVIFDQKGCRFKPHTLLVRAGQTRHVISDDSTAHNTHTYPTRNDPFNAVITPNDRNGKALIYKKGEKKPVEVKCDFHAWMRAYHLPLDHPYAAITGADGSFKIEGVPAGKHKFRIWHEKAGFLSRGYEVEIKPDAETPISISYGADKFATFEGPKPKSVVISALR